MVLAGVFVLIAVAFYLPLFNLAEGRPDDETRPIRAPPASR